MIRTELFLSLVSIVAALLVAAATCIVIAELVAARRQRQQDRIEGYADGLDRKRQQAGRSPTYHDAWRAGRLDAPPVRLVNRDMAPAERSPR